ncbi:MAG: phosphoglycolate phosphatase [Pseudomonadota bacterium]
MNLVFDLDGTLVDSAPDLQAATNHMLGQEGAAPVDLPTATRFIGNGVPTLVARARRHRGLEDSEAQQAEALARFQTYYSAHAADLTKLYPGVLDALGSLRAEGHAMALCTNKPEAPARALLRALGLESFFQTVIGGDTTPAHKPDPRPVHAALAGLGEGPAAYIGDSEVDAQAALNAGLPFLLFTEGYRKSPASEIEAEARFADFADLPALVQGLAAQV